MYGNPGARYIEMLYNRFEEEMLDNGIGMISEVYDGDPPHQAGGAISQAWKVAELLRIRCMLDNLKKRTE